MGRWAQRRRRGGGGPGLSVVVPPITIDAVSSSSGLDVFSDFTFSAPVTAADFAPGDFTFDPGTGFEAAIAVAQAAANVLTITWANACDNGNPWAYAGSAPNVVTPQSGTMV